jgi:hypothetical protein
MKIISIVTPIRRRPDNVKRMLNSIKETMSGLNKIQVIFRIDNNDEILDQDFRFEIYKMMEHQLTINFIMGPETFPDMGKLWNDCVPDIAGEIVQFGGDDLVYRTKDWDSMVVKAFEEYPDQIVMVWGNDSTFGSKLATHGFLSKKWIDTVGWFFPPIGLTYANDDFIFAMMRNLSRLHYIGELSIKHKWDGSNPNAENYGRMGEHFQRSHDLVVSEIGQNCMREAINKLRAVMS